MTYPHLSSEAFQASAILLQATAEAWNLNKDNTNYKYKERGYKYKLTDFSTFKLRRASLVQVSAPAWNSNANHTEYKYRENGYKYKEIYFSSYTNTKNTGTNTNKQIFLLLS